MESFRTLQYAVNSINNRVNNRICGLICKVWMKIEVICTKNYKFNSLTKTIIVKKLSNLVYLRQSNESCLENNGKIDGRIRSVRKIISKLNTFFKYTYFFNRKEFAKGYISLNWLVNKLSYVLENENLERRLQVLICLNQSSF